MAVLATAPAQGEVSTFSPPSAMSLRVSRERRCLTEDVPFRSLLAESFESERVEFYQMLFLHL